MYEVFDYSYPSFQLLEYFKLCESIVITNLKYILDFFFFFSDNEIFS